MARAPAALSRIDRALVPTWSGSASEVTKALRWTPPRSTTSKAAAACRSRPDDRQDALTSWAPPEASPGTDRSASDSRPAPSGWPTPMRRESKRICTSSHPWNPVAETSSSVPAGPDRAPPPAARTSTAWTGGGATDVVVAGAIVVVGGSVVDTGGGTVDVVDPALVVVEVRATRGGGGAEVDGTSGAHPRSAQRDSATTTSSSWVPGPVGRSWTWAARTVIA